MTYAEVNFECDWITTINDKSLVTLSRHFDSEIV